MSLYVDTLFESVTGDRELPLSFAQKRLWFLHRLEPQGASYNVPAELELLGSLDIDALGRSVSEVVRRHEVLRTTFGEQGGQPVQRVEPASAVPLAVVDLSGVEPGERAVQAEKLAVDDARAPFDLERGPLVRATLVRLQAEEHRLLLNMHHIVSDAWSSGVLARELGVLYRAFAAGEASPLPELGLQYADFARWQSDELQGERLASELGYWRRQLLGKPPLLLLPTDRRRPARQSFRGSTYPVVLPGALRARLEEASRREGVTVYMMLLASFQLWLARLSGQTDIAVGAPIANRNRTELEGLIGFFVNTLVLRTDLSGNPTFRALLRRVREVTLGAYGHQDVPFEKLVEELNPARDLSYSPLFQVMLVLQNVPMSELGLPGLQTRWRYVPTGTTKFDLLLTLEAEGGELVGNIEYSTDLFEEATIERWVAQLMTLLEAVADAPETRIMEVCMLPEAERRCVVESWNQTGEGVSECIDVLLAAQAARTPEAVAVSFSGHNLTYAELWAEATALAHHLRALGVGPEVIVGICMERTLDVVVAIVAVLAAGGAYLPLDPAYPRERLELMLEDSGARVLLTQARVHAEVLSGVVGDGLVATRPGQPLQPLQVVRVDQRAEWCVHEPHPVPPERRHSAHNLAYVIYTSGSTGRPKGAGIEHHSVATLLAWARDTYRPEQLRGVLAATSLCFDSSVFELLVPLCWGGRVILAQNALSLPSVPEAGEVTLVSTVPSAVAELLRLGALPRSVTTVNLAGEPLPTALAQSLYGQSHITDVVNLYGLTEMTVYSTSARVPDPTTVEVTIGRPITGTQIYILDAAMEPVPIGVQGEIYIGGVGLGRNYIHRPALTAERFVPDPFARTRPGARMYRTGDLGRYLADGDIEFLGRADNQVKLRGFRIELGEVEAALAAHPGVREAVVLLREDVPGEPRLVGYWVSASEPPPERESVRAFVQARLPGYMVPSVVVRLADMPRTPNGKVDRRAFPAPEEQEALCGDGGGAEYVAPQTPTELRVARIFGEVLRAERIGADQSFFERGGHSLLATQVVSRVRDAWRLELPLAAIFEAPTIAGLARRIDALRSAAGEGEESDEATGLRPIARQGALRLSFAQERLWFLEQLTPGCAVYNVPDGLRMRGPLDVAVLRRALSEIVRRHETLRTSFVEVDGTPVQVIEPAAEVPVPVVELGERIDGAAAGAADRDAAIERLAMDEARREAARPFDLRHGPLMRARLLRLAADDHILLITTHHIVSDGWSLGVFNHELGALYTAFVAGLPSPLPALAVQYADVADWQRRRLQGPVLEAQLAYWKAALDPVPAPLMLPGDRPRPAVQTLDGAVLSLVLDEPLCSALEALSRRHEVTLFMTLLAGFQAWLARLSGQTDIAVGSPIANRTRSELEPLIGFFVNTLVLRTDLSGEPSFEELLQRVRRVTLDAYAHQDVPFEKLVEELNPQRDLSSTPLFQVMFVLQNAPEHGIELPGIETRPVVMHTGTAMFDMSLSMSKQGGRLVAELEYNQALFDRTTVTRWAGQLQTLLAGAARAPAAPVSALPFLAGAERDTLRAWSDSNAAFAADAAIAADAGPWIHQLIAAQAEHMPDAVAVVCGSEQVSYRELVARANQLAHHLVAAGVGAEVRVGVCVTRSVEMVISILGVLQAGGAYVPLDPGYPAERLAFMLEDAGIEVLITREAQLAALPLERLARPADIICVDRDRAMIARYPAHDPGTALGAENLAYMMYTSGSSGRPKGVMTHHGGLRQSTAARLGTYEPPACALLLWSFAFDSSVAVIFGTLCQGGRLLVPPGELAWEPRQMAALIAEHGVTHLDVPPSLHALLLEQLEPDQLSSLRTVIVGGETCPSALVALHTRRLPQVALYNEYGPTEGTVWSSVHRCTAADGQSRVPIGRPIAGMQTHILDAHLEPVPIGVPGELYLGGGALARGYHARPGLTAERFVPDPLSGQAGARLYRTGDAGRWRADGQLEFLGRVDEQIKLRGYRIELTEIEDALAGHPEVLEAAAVAHGSGEAARIVAYWVAAGDTLAAASGDSGHCAGSPGSADSPESGQPAGDPGDRLRAYLARRLPTYMVPSALVKLALMPRTANGKVDRQSLPAPEAWPSDSRNQVVAPRDTLELELVRLWQSLLGVEPIGVTSDFFELGGHSLLAVRHMSALEQRFGRSLPLSALFQSSTVEQLAQLLRDDDGSAPRTGLVAIQPHGRKPPFFCVHPVGGNVLCYAALARQLGEEQPLYGLEASGLGPGDAPREDIEQMAAAYIEAIQAVEPDGPYFLGGWSMGGDIAYAMAQTLEQRGHDVAVLALFDSVAPGCLVSIGELEDAALLTDFTRDLASSSGKRNPFSEDELAEIPANERFERVMTWAASERLVPHGTGSQRVKRLFRVYAANMRALQGYSPEPYSGAITLFQAEASTPRQIAEQLQGWQGLTRSHVDTYSIPGDHYSILTQPGVTVLAEHLCRCLAAAQSSKKERR